MDWQSIRTASEWLPLSAALVAAMYLFGFVFSRRYTKVDFAIALIIALLPSAIVSISLPFNSGLHPFRRLTLIEATAQYACLSVAVAQVGLLAGLLFRAFRRREWSVWDGSCLIVFLSLAGLDALLSLGALVGASAIIEGSPL